MADRYVDCKKLNCPMPIVRISKNIKEMSDGELLEVDATDPAFRADLEAWVTQTGNELVEFTDGPIQKAIIRKGHS